MIRGEAHRDLDPISQHPIAAGGGNTDRLMQPDLAVVTTGCPLVEPTPLR
jgi:hypothetical protein